MQVKGTFGFRNKHVKLAEAVYGASVEDSDRFELAMAQWQSTAEGAVASTALEVKIATWRLLHFFDRCARLATRAWPAVINGSGDKVRLLEASHASLPCCM